MSVARRFAALSALALAGAATTVYAGDSAWSDEASVEVHVNGHEFHKVHVDGHGCGVSVRLLFTAPEKGYSDPRNRVRNYQRFQARVKFAKGESVESRVFGNSDPGERAYDFEADTSGASCWSKQADKIVKLDVIGCRGRACDLGAFE